MGMTLVKGPSTPSYIFSASYHCLDSHELCIQMPWGPGAKYVPHLSSKQMFTACEADRRARITCSSAMIQRGLWEDCHTGYRSIGKEG